VVKVDTEIPRLPDKLIAKEDFIVFKVCEGVEVRVLLPGIVVLVLVEFENVHIPRVRALLVILDLCLLLINLVDTRFPALA